MAQIRRGFRYRVDAKEFRNATVAESSDLWKYEPHPMAAFASRSKLRTYLFIDAALSVHKALQIVWIIHLLIQRLGEPV
jgi:hypothetical protein